MQSHEDLKNQAGVFTGVRLEAAPRVLHPSYSEMQNVGENKSTARGNLENEYTHKEKGHGHPHSVEVNQHPQSGYPKGGHPHGGGNQDDANRFFAREGVDALTMAFESKIAVHPGMGGRPMDKDKMQAKLAELAQIPRTGKSVAYIHVPFCETHCLYCGFYKNPYKKSDSPSYVDTLIKELSLWGGSKVQNDGPIHAVYLGGGTPTALEPDDLTRLLLAIKEKLPLANDCELTVEGRTSNLTKERIEAMLKGGANRFSLGVQTFNTEIRQALGRRSSREELIEKIQLLLSYNEASVLIDLIYGLPGQTKDIWLDDIQTAQGLKLDGADLYQLNIFKNSLLSKAIEKGKMPDGANISEQAKYFESGVKAMQEGFYRRLSVSHWGRTPRERNIYNQYVKGTANCLFFGPGAGGNLHGYFGFNNPDYASWSEQVEKGIKPVLMLIEPDKHAGLFKTIAEEMEQSRLPLMRLEREFNIPLSKLLDPLLSQWKRAGLMQEEGGGHVLTLAGQFWQVNLTQLLLEYLGKSLKETN